MARRRVDEKRDEGALNDIDGDTIDCAPPSKQNLFEATEDVDENYSPYDTADSSHHINYYKYDARIRCTSKDSGNGGSIRSFDSRSVALQPVISVPSTDDAPDNFCQPRPGLNEDIPDSMYSCTSRSAPLIAPRSHTGQIEGARPYTDDDVDCAIVSPAVEQQRYREIGSSLHHGWQRDMRLSMPSDHWKTNDSTESGFESMSNISTAATHSQNAHSNSSASQGSVQNQFTPSQKASDNSNTDSSQSFTEPNSSVWLNKSFSSPQQASSDSSCLPAQYLNNWPWIPDKDGDTPALLNVYHGVEETALNYIKFAPHYTVLSTQNNLGQTILHAAVLTNQPNVVRMAVVCGTNIRLGDSYQNLALHYCAEFNTIDCLKALTKKISPREHLSVCSNHTRECVIPKQRLPQNRNDFNEFNDQGYTPLLLSVIHHNWEIMKILITECHSNINLGDRRSGRTALHYAAETGNLFIVEFLLSRLANPNVRAFDNSTPARYAKINGHVLVVEKLNEYGGFVSPSDDDDDMDDESSSSSEDHSNDADSDVDLDKGTFHQRAAVEMNSAGAGHSDMGVPSDGGMDTTSALSINSQLADQYNDLKIDGEAIN